MKCPGQVLLDVVPISASGQVTNLVLPTLQANEMIVSGAGAFKLVERESVSIERNKGVPNPAACAQHRRKHFPVVTIPEGIGRGCIRFYIPRYRALVR